MSYRLIFFLAAMVIAQTGTTQLFGEQQVISTQVAGANSVYTADLDDDGDLDVLSASDWADMIAWYENLGGGLFGSQQIISTAVIHTQDVHAADLDGDGDQDVLSASQNDDKIAWYENLGGGIFGSQQVISLLAESPPCVYSADLDEDGDMDVLSTSIPQDKIAWYENLGGGIFESEQIISSQANGPNTVYTADIDGDGDMDILSASQIDDTIAWYENLGGGTFGSQQIISAQVNGANFVYANDIDGDGDMDALSTAGVDDELAWFENLDGGNFGPEQIISIEFDGIQYVFAADLDGDSDIDVLSASYMDNKVAWYENLGGGNFGTQQIISLQANGATCVYAADLDGDSDMDVLSGSYSGYMVAWYENLTLMGGCLDPGACNYEPNVDVDNGSCCYANCGCTNPLAANYSETAVCDNGSCAFSITGTVFFDENEDGVMNGNDYGLPFQTVVIEESGQTYMTNDDGNFIANLGQSQFGEFSLQGNPDFPFNTTPNPVSFDAETAETTQLLFGISNELAEFEVDIHFYPSGNFFLCDEYSNHSISFRNLGNVPIDGIIEIEYDELFLGYLEVTPIDSANGNTVYMSFENLLPGEMRFYTIILFTPSVFYIGEYVTSYANIYGYYDGEQVAYGEQELTMQIACAYDPNDKQAFPLGYTDEHWLLQETEQEFVIRFQNTGNAPAQNIRIQDTLDVNFDITSFRLIANSHSVMTTIDPETRLVDFYFENIQLPDSVNNEPASHGVISYMITPLPNLPVGTVLENTAYIYFDNNDPIITNTTWTTIHECGGESAFEPVTVLVCDVPQVNFANSYEYVENYSWLIDGEEAGVNSELLLSSIDQSGYEVTLTASNPLCTETTTLNYLVPPIEAIDPCRADFNCDGNRDTQDLLVFMNEFGCLNACEADLDDNAIVNVGDLFIFISVFDQSCWE